jgi:DUF917 family protein
MYTLNQQQLDDLLLGATALATGGGCVYEQKIQILQQMNVEAISILEASDIAPDDCLCTVYAVGPTSVQDDDLEERLRIGCAAVERVLGKKLTAIFIGELGAEHLAMKAASLLNVSVVDADGTGGRAVPEIVQDQFGLRGRNTTPAIVVTKDGEIEIIQELEPQALEARIRDIAVRTQSLVLVFDHLMNGSDLSLLSCGNLKRARDIGTILRERDVNALRKLGFTLIDEARVLSIQKYPDNDFLRADVELTGRKGMYQLAIQNEHLVLWREGKPIVTCPHLIILLDEQARPVHNAHIGETLGQTLTILSLRALPAWQTAIGYSLFSPKRFGIDVEVTYEP